MKLENGYQKYLPLEVMASQVLDWFDILLDKVTKLAQAIFGSQESHVDTRDPKLLLVAREIAAACKDLNSYENSQIQAVIKALDGDGTFYKKLRALPMEVRNAFAKISNCRSLVSLPKDLTNEDQVYQQLRLGHQNEDQMQLVRDFFSGLSIMNVQE